jgi:nickel/cobalt transporter (NicO) family protein
MLEALIYLASSFWLGAIHAATPGHGKTIAAAYIVGVRGKPVDAWILGIFVTLSHTSGILLVGLLASLGLPGFLPQRMEAYLSLLTGLLVIAIGLWTLWTQRALVQQLPTSALHTHDGLPEHTHEHTGNHVYTPVHAHEHGSDGHTHGDHQQGEAGYHSHGWGFKHTHDMDLVTVNRPSLWVLIGLGVAGGLIPDPAALGILLNAVAQGKMMLGLGTVIVFSLGFAGTLVVVGIVAAKVGRKILDWLAGPWAVRMQLATSALIVVVGLVLTYQAWRMLAQLA